MVIYKRAPYHASSICTRSRGIAPTEEDDSFARPRTTCRIADHFACLWKTVWICRLSYRPLRKVTNSPAT